MKTRKFWMILLPLALVIGLMFGGCGGSDGSDGKSAYQIAVDNGFTGTEEEWLATLAGGGGTGPGDGSWFGEYCTSCHEYDAFMHQASYNQLYQDGIIEVTNLAYAYSDTIASSIVTFEMTKFGNAFDCLDADSLGIYFSSYNGTTFDVGRLDIEGTVAYNDTTNVCTATAASADLSAEDGIIVVYGRDETVASIPGTRVAQAKYPFAAVEVLGDVDYASPANVSGCEKCHTVPFLKHGYIYANVGDPGLDFYTCKACHLDEGEGGHFVWQLLVNDPNLIITLEEEYGEDWEELAYAAGDLDDYAYKTKLMNDVHMSHAMEFPYPQSMSNCATCHTGPEGDNLAAITDPANFVLETCKSCHPLYDDPDNIMEAPGLWAVAPTAAGIFDHTTYDDTTVCTSCHSGGATPSFAEIHTGYDPVIYTDENNGTKYADVISVSIDSATYNGDDITIQFTVDDAAYGGSLAVTVEPYRVYVGLYGQATKDFRATANVRSGSADINTTANPGTWEATVDVSEWDYLVGMGNERAEIGVMVEAEAGGETVAVNAVSRTFNLNGNNFVASPAAIVSVEDGCNNCHDALGTTFHSPARGGSVVVCRLCHVSITPGSHLELQSRSIDSYVHAIHSFQPFDIGNIDFEDPLEELHYEHHIGFVYPVFGLTNCESCHEPGMYDVPDQYGSMPGVLSGSDDVEGRDIDVPESVTGPAARACGACHKVGYLNHGDAAGLADLNQHFENYGYLWENDSNDVIRDFIIDTVFSVYVP